MCKICTCILRVDQQKLEDTYQELQARRFRDTEDFHSFLVTTSHFAEDVISGDVCMTLCLEEVEMVNGWTYNSQSRTCTCGWLESTNCIKDLLLAETGTFQVSDISLKTEAFLALEMYLDCSKFVASKHKT